MTTFLLVVAVGIIAALALQVVFSKGSEARPPEHPVDEARVFAAYGQKKRALAILQGYLQAHPGDASARELLNELERG
jgi:hypothetical protein